MIRFSAALVAVAIGVLIGGIAASKLLLVYIAIVLSAVALVVLAIGVALKREELFGEAPGQPAQADAGPVLPARAGESYEHSRLNGQVPPPPLQGAAVGPGAAFAGHSQAAPPASGGALAGGTWESQAGRGSWPSPVTAAPASPGWEVPAPTAGDPMAQGSTVQGGAVQGGAVQASGAAPRPWATSAPSVFAPRPADTPPEAGPGTAPPSWFNSFGKATSAEPPAPAPGTGGGWSWLNNDTTVSEDKGNTASEDQGNKTQDPAAPEEDDDWPTRYSWLDDEPEENSETPEAQPAESPAAPWGDAAPKSYSAVPADVAATVSAPEIRTSETTAPETTAAYETSMPAPDALADATALADDTAVADGTQLADDPEPSSGPLAGTAAATVPSAPVAAGTAEAPAQSTAPAGSITDADEQPTLHLVRDPDLEAALAPEAPGGQGSEPAGDGAGLVTVVRGVPRFHQADCVLIRFMPEGDTQKLTVAEAREAGCTPCTACQPEG